LKIIKSRESENRPSNQKSWIGEQTKQSKAMNRRTDQAIKSRESENRPSNQKPWIGEQIKQSKAVNRRTDQAIKSRELENRPSNQKPWIGEQTKQSKAMNRRTDQAIKSHESENRPTNQKPWIGEQTKQWQEGIKTNNLLENTKQKTWATRTTLKTGGEFGWFGRISSSCYTSGTHRVISNKGGEMRCCAYDKGTN
jgi:hypothetical protein